MKNTLFYLFVTVPYFVLATEPGLQLPTALHQTPTFYNPQLQTIAESQTLPEGVDLGTIPTPTLSPPIPEEYPYEAPPTHIKPPAKNAFLAYSLNFLNPGLALWYLDQPDLGIQLALIAGASSLALEYSTDPHLQQSAFFTLAHTIVYGLHSTYRELRKLNGEHTYKYAMANDSLKDLIQAPFNPQVLKKPEVWGGVLGGLALGIALDYLAVPESACLTDEDRKEMNPNKEVLERLDPHPLVAFSVGIGEESLFRGLLQPMLTEYTSPAGGIILSSLLFGLIHIPNAWDMLKPDECWRYYCFSIPYITAAGMYFGYLTHKNQSLKESVAVHALYDFVLMLGEYYTTKTVIGKKRITYGFAF